MLPREYFDDPLTCGTAYGALQHVVNNRFTLLKLPTGYGKTTISMRVASTLANIQNGSLQLMIIAPKAKRLDNSFTEAVESTEKYFDVSLNVLPINEQQVGTFAGVNAMKKKEQMWNGFVQRLKEQPTLLILDETHMQLRNATGLANKTFKKLFKEIEKAGSQLKILGLTATPFDKSIIDSVGYLVLNGNYTSRTNFYRREVKGYGNSYSRGINQRDIENMIVDDSFKIHKEMFNDINRVISSLKMMFYMPLAPRNFHIPENHFEEVNVELSSEGQKRLKRVELMEKEKAYPDNGSKITDYTKVLTTDPEILNQVLKLVQDSQINQPLIFYSLNNTRDAVIELLTKHDIDYLEVNGHSQSYFKKNDRHSPVLVQFKSGAAAFESKASNTSIYLDLPASSIDYQQSLGRNARRGQEIEYVTNYIIHPLKANGRTIKYFEKKHNQIVNKTKWNEKFEKTFETPWGQFEEDTL